MTAPDAPVLIIGGPTASGKSALAVDLAEAWGGIVVSADAMTVYRGLDVGTAKPSAEDRARAPHRCLDLRDPHEDFNVADFLAEVDAARVAGRPVIVAGGTPFWLAALVRPLSRLPEPDPALRVELEQIDDLHGALAAVDPESAARLHPHDRVRLVRALEVFRLTGAPLSAAHAAGAGRPPVPHALVWLDRDDLQERIGDRLAQMVAGDYLGELRRALDAGAPPDCKPLKSFAYVHLVAHLREGLPWDEALRRTRRDTWRLARKQRTWARGMGWSAAAPAAAWSAAEATFGPRPGAR